jgi:hypothetical protein
MKIFKSILLAVGLIIILSYPFGQFYRTIAGPGGGFLASDGLDTLTGSVYAFIFSVIFCLNLLPQKKRFLWMLIISALPIWFVYSDYPSRWWYPTLIIVFAFVLSEITKLVTKKIQSKKQKIS